MQSDKIKTGAKINKLMRYRAIKADFDLYKTEDIPTTVIWRKYIYPKWFISRTTLYNVLCTPVNKEIRELNEQLQLQL